MAQTTVTTTTKTNNNTNQQSIATSKGLPKPSEEQMPIYSQHPNGRPIVEGYKRPHRDDSLLHQDIFPDNYLGRLLRGLQVEYLIKQEHRSGWARKSACDPILQSHPNETVAAHQWGVAVLVMTIAEEPKFQEELPHFDQLKAIKMALMHDVPELMTGDITPVDGITPEEKHQLESKAMEHILDCFPGPVKESLRIVYNSYEDRRCAESKFVKDCDKLDFMIQAFLLERQGFTGFEEFYPNSIQQGFSTKIAEDLAHLLIETRHDLLKKNLLYTKNC